MKETNMSNQQVNKQETGKIYETENLTIGKSEEVKKMDLMNKVACIQADIKDLIKDEKNKGQNYKYFEESQILRILKPLLKHYRVRIIVSDDDTQPLQWDREGNKHFLRYLKQMKVSNLDNKDDFEIVKFWACGDNTDIAKAKGATETYSMKYILSKFFLIRVIDEDEPDRKDTGEAKPTQTAQKSTEKTGTNTNTTWK